MAWLVLGFALVLALAPRAGSAQRFGAGRPPQQPGLGQRPGGAPGWGGAGGANYPSYGDSDGLGSPCNYDEDCDAMEHTYCRNQRTCECKKGFRASASNDRCLATVGAPCSTKYDCSGLGSAGECRQGVCDCGGDHVPSPDGSCLKAALRINDVCEEDLQCEGLGLGTGQQQQQQQQHPWGQGASTGATCVAGKCQCAPGTHPSNDRCVANRALHEPCSENSECFIGDGYQSVVTCHMGTCRCRTHYVDLGDGKCTAGAKNVNTASTPAIMLLVLLMLFVVNK